MAKQHVYLMPSKRVTGMPTAAEWYRENEGQKVEVYRNLHRDTWSVRRNGRVIGHSNGIVLRTARFVVQPGGRDRARRDGVRNVHAFVRGILSHSPEFNNVGRQVTYSPFNASGTFMTRSGFMVDRADVVRFTRGECSGYGLTRFGQPVVDSELQAEAWRAA